MTAAVAGRERVAEVDAFLCGEPDALKNIKPQRAALAFIVACAAG